MNCLKEHVPALWCKALAVSMFYTGEVIGMQAHGVRFVNLSRANQRPVFDLNDWDPHP